MRNLKEGIEIIPTAMDEGGNVEAIQGDLLAPEAGIRAATIDVKVGEGEIIDQEEAVNKGVEAVNKGVEAVKGVQVKVLTIKAAVAIGPRVEVLSVTGHVAVVRKYWRRCHN